MEDEPGGAGVEGLPFKSKDAWPWVGRAVLLIAVLWSQNNFVSRVQYERDKDQAESRRMMIMEGMNNINTTLTRIDEKWKNDARQDAVLADHEQRVRTLEKTMYGKGP